MPFPNLRRSRSSRNHAEERTPLLGTECHTPEAGLEMHVAPPESEEHDSSVVSGEPTEADITIGLIALYALATGFTTANLYYCQPILDVLAAHFNVSESQIADLPAIAQAGNALGLLTILPVADFLPKRLFLLVLMTLLAIFW